MKSDHSFVGFVDETGDEGYRFATGGKGGSSIWFAQSAVVYLRANELEQVKCVDDARVRLGKQSTKPLHFSYLTHEQKLVYSAAIGKSKFGAVSVCVYKPNIVGVDRFTQRSELYNYAGMLLLERVSWMCALRFRNKKHPVSGDGSAKIIFSERGTFCPIKFRAYLADRDNEGKCNINWNVIDPDGISDAPHRALRGLQVADTFASSLGSALNPHHVSGLTEHRYLKNLWPRVWHYKGERCLSYGMKFFPSTAVELGNAISDEVQDMLGLLPAQ